MRRRSFLVMIAFVCCGVLGYAAVAVARHVDKPSLTPGQRDTIVADLTLAVPLEQTALTQLADADEMGARTSLNRSEKYLEDGAGLSGAHLGHADPLTYDLARAANYDIGAVNDLLTDDRIDAIGFVQKALTEKMAALSLLGANTSPAITSLDSCDALQGTAATCALAATGQPTPTFSISGNPSNITLTDNGNATGTVNVSALVGNGVYPITVTAANGVSPNATQTLTITVGTAPTITSTGICDEPVGSAKTCGITTSGFPIAAIHSATTLPPGFAITDNSNGTGTLGLSATIAAGSYSIPITASNVFGTANQTITVAVSNSCSINATLSSCTVTNPTTSSSCSVHFSAVGATWEVLDLTVTRPPLASGVGGSLPFLVPAPSGHLLEFLGGGIGTIDCPPG
jgi:hypothetical protein